MESALARCKKLAIEYPNTYMFLQSKPSNMPVAFYLGTYSPWPETIPAVQNREAELLSGIALLFNRKIIIYIPNMYDYVPNSDSLILVRK